MAINQEKTITQEIPETPSLEHYASSYLIYRKKLPGGMAKWRVGQSLQLKCPPNNVIMSRKAAMLYNITTVNCQWIDF